MGGPPAILVDIPHQISLCAPPWPLPCVPTKTWLFMGPDEMDLENNQDGDWVPATPELFPRPR